jgi:hypothetical protein
MGPVTSLLVLIALGAPASAQSVAPAAPKLENAADGQDQEVFDGQRRYFTSDGLELLDEKKDILLKTEKVPAHRECHEPPGSSYDGMTGPAHEPRLLCGEVKAHTELTYGDRQTFRIDNRAAFEGAADERGARNGALIGGAIGALGFLFALLGPWGWGVGAGCILLGALIGAGIGAHIEAKKARDTHETFDRDFPKRTVNVVP